MWTRPGGQQRVARAFALFLAIGLAANCAAFNRKNTPLVAAVEDHLVPESTAGKVAAFPLILPVGIVAGILDVFIVHPISVIPEAAADVRRIVWKPNSKSGYVTIMGAIPFKLIATPVFFTIDWLLRSAFDFADRSPNAEPIRPDAPAWQRLPVAKLMERGQFDAAAMRMDYLADKPREPDESEDIKKLYSAFKKESLRMAAQRYLGHPARVKRNESYLVELLENGLQGQAASADIVHLMDILTRARSSAASAAALGVLRTGKLQGELFNLTVRLVLDIGVPDHVRAIRAALRQIPEP